MNLVHILIIVLIVLAVLSLPRWGYTPQTWNYYPAGGLGLVLVILLILLLLGRL